MLLDLGEALQMDLSWGAACVGVVGGLSAWAFAVMHVRTIHEQRDQALKHLAKAAADGLRQAENDGMERLEQLRHSHLQATLRLQYAQWWANNAAESNSSEGLRFTLLEIALFTLASESIDQVREMLTTRVATERDNERASVLRAALGELELKRATGEPWHPWLRHAEERGPVVGYADFHPHVLAWWRSMLERGGYTSRVRVLQLAIDVLAAISEEGQRVGFAVPEHPAGVRELLELALHRRIVSNSRPLPVYGENLQ